MRQEKCHHHIVLQNKAAGSLIPSLFQFNRWCQETLAEQNTPVELTICIVDEASMADLNQQYRDKSGPTNVLAFPFGEMPQIDDEIKPLGDVIICAAVVEKEAKQQGKPRLAHWAHITVHGTLHLLGYDHQTDEEAHQMEALEAAILARLHIENPYQFDDNDK